MALGDENDHHGQINHLRPSGDDPLFQDKKFHGSRNCCRDQFCMTPSAVVFLLLCIGPPWQMWFPSVLWPWRSKDDPSGALVS